MAVIYLGSSSNKNIKQLSLLKFCVGLKIETNLCCNVAQLNCTVLLPQYILCISICYNLPIWNFQESQVTIECVIPQKYHRTVMGAKGSKVQQVTQDFEVTIKFPDRPATECK